MFIIVIFNIIRRSLTIRELNTIRQVHCAPYRCLKSSLFVQNKITWDGNASLAVCGLGFVAIISPRGFTYLLDNTIVAGGNY